MEYFLGVIAILVIITYGILVIKSSNKPKEEVEKLIELKKTVSQPLQKVDYYQRFINQVNKYNTKYSIQGENGDFYVIADEDKELLVYIDWWGSTREIPFSKLMSVQIIEDSQVLYQKSVMDIIGDASIGKLIGGNAGAIIGGLSSPHGKRAASKIQVVINIDDLSKPTLKFNLFNGKSLTGGKADYLDLSGSVERGYYRRALSRAERIAAMVNIAIARANANTINNTTEIDSKISIADEIVKLADLKEKNLISEEEFVILKNKLITT